MTVDAPDVTVDSAAVLPAPRLPRRRTLSCFRSASGDVSLSRFVETLRLALTTANSSDETGKIPDREAGSVRDRLDDSRRVTR